MSEYKLSAARVDEVFRDCLFKGGEDTSTHVKAEGIQHPYGFHPERLESHRDEIELMLSQLPDSFMASKGGGMSFLNACMDRHDNHWAEHATMDQLFCLGLGIDKVKCCMPREMWSVLPGGMPYYQVIDVEPAANPAGAVSTYTQYP